MDAQHAWKNLGGLQIDEAKAKFRENALYYQEDFMFMGGSAFAYYFPVIEDHLRTVPQTEGDHESWILAHCIRTQFDGDNLGHVRSLAERIIDLADFVRDNVDRFGADNSERQRVVDVWAELVHHIKNVTES